MRCIIKEDFKVMAEEGSSQKWVQGFEPGYFGGGLYT